MDFENIMLSGVSQRKTPYDFTYMWNLKNKINKTDRLIDTENRLMGGRREGVWETGWEMWRDSEVQIVSYKTVTGR